jgi:hypothetical protein
LPIGWEAVLLEAVIPQLVNGEANLERRWLDERGVPVLQDAIFSSTEPDQLLEGMDELPEDEVEMIEQSTDFPPMEDCWQEMVGQLDELIADGHSDSPMACDFCKQDLVPNEPAMRIRHCLVTPNPRDPNGAKLQPVKGYSEFIMCLSCCLPLSKEIVRQQDGKDLWPTL